MVDDINNSTDMIPLIVRIHREAGDLLKSQVLGFIGKPAIRSQGIMNRNKKLVVIRRINSISLSDELHIIPVGVVAILVGRTRLFRLYPDNKGRTVRCV